MVAKVVSQSEIDQVCRQDQDVALYEAEYDEGCQITVLRGPGPVSEDQDKLKEYKQRVKVLEKTLATGLATSPNGQS